MINILLFDNDFNLNEALSHQVQGSEKLTVITPNPSIADIARVKFAKSHNNLETVTISHFLKSELKQLIDNERLENYQGKSELNLLLGSLWKLGRSESSYELFKRCFQMLTDFRSFSMNEEVLKTVLEEYDEKLGGAVFWFHKIMMEMDIIDEHRSYFLLADELRIGDLPPLYKTNKTIMFWGFDFMTASQVDLLNAFAIRDEVIVPFYRNAYEKSNDLDWIKWLSKTEANIIEASSDNISQKKINLIEFPKNYLSKTLDVLRTDERFKDKPINLVLGTKNIKEEFVSEIPYDDISYKVSMNLFSEKVSKLREYCFSLFEAENVTSTELFIDNLKEHAQLVLKDSDYRYFKVISLAIEQFVKWNNLSENNETIGEFDLKIIFDSVFLNVPRNSLFKGNQGSTELKGLKNIDKIEKSDIQFLCLSSEYGPIKGSVNQYSENVEKYLASLGPVRRSELEYLQAKEKINEFLNKDNTYVLAESGLLEHDIGWNSIIEESRRSHFDAPPFKTTNVEYIATKAKSKNELKSISATRLQSYADCPRKYYFNYIEKKMPLIEIPGRLNFLQLGLIEHKVIEEYLKSNTVFDEEAFKKLVSEELLAFQKEVKFRTDLLEEYELEIISLCTNIIKELLTLNNQIGLNLKCEYPLPSTESIQILGSIDCVGMNSDTLIVLDFKRGGGSIPSQVGLKSYKKIQLWFYLERLKIAGLYKEGMKLIWGYINLSSLEDSLVYCNDETLMSILKDHDLQAFSKMNLFDEKMESLSSEYKDFEMKLVEDLKNDSEFKCAPIESQTCSYCNLSNICPRKEVV